MIHSKTNTKQKKANNKKTRKQQTGVDSLWVICFEKTVGNWLQNKQTVLNLLLVLSVTLVCCHTHISLSSFWQPFVDSSCFVKALSRHCCAPKKQRTLLWRSGSDRNCSWVLSQCFCWRNNHLNISILFTWIVKKNLVEGNKTWCQVMWISSNTHISQALFLSLSE